MQEAIDFMGHHAERLPDGVVRLHLRVKPADFATLGFRLEALEGWCSYSEDNSTHPRGMMIDIMPDYIEEIKAFLRVVGVL
jgi:hypothetical protein